MCFIIKKLIEKISIRLKGIKALLLDNDFIFVNFSQIVEIADIEVLFPFIFYLCAHIVPAKTKTSDTALS